MDTRLDSDIRSSRWLSRFSILAAISTLPLIFMGGLVTSHSAALAVPDWPTSYGYNMFWFPWHKMVGGIFYEHSHRLLGSIVGFLTLVLAIWMAFQEKRPWMRKLGWIALAVVSVQGLLGGWRVLSLNRQIAIFHACLAQAFFSFMVAIALFQSSWWKRRESVQPERQDKTLRKWVVWTTALIFLQLILGAVMRHTDSGLAVPDFPLIYGKVLPPLDAAALEQINQERIYQWSLERVSFLQVVFHLGHRLGALLVAASIIGAVSVIWKRHWDCKELKWLSLILISLLVIQLGLGMSVIWTQKAADIATAHVAVGALTLATSSLLGLIVFKLVGCPVREPDLAWTPAKETAL